MAENDGICGVLCFCKKQSCSGEKDSRSAKGVHALFPHVSRLLEMCVSCGFLHIDFPAEASNGARFGNEISVLQKSSDPKLCAAAEHPCPNRDSVLLPQKCSQTIAAPTCCFRSVGGGWEDMTYRLEMALAVV